MLEILPAKKTDSGLILRYIKELTEAEKFPFNVSVTQADIETNLFGATPAAEALIIYQQQNPCGFAVYYHTFSTTTGRRGLHLDDLYIEPKAQGQGLGKKVFSYLARLALDRHCARFEWWAVKTNVDAIRLYENMGARDLEEISIFRLDPEDILIVAAGLE
ncbi:MAG: GNAT family N-acetyltransferase [Arenicellales bacterium]